MTATPDDKTAEPIWVEGDGWMHWDGFSWQRWDGFSWQQAGPANPPPAAGTHQHQGSVQTARSDNRPASAPSGAFLAGLVGAAAIVIGSFIPFVAAPDDQLPGLFVMNPAALHLSTGFGLLLALLISFAHAPTRRRGVSLTTAILAALGIAGYALFTCAGYVGVTTDQDFFPVKVHWRPDAGLLFSLIGCLIVLIAATKLRSSMKTGPSQ